MNEQNLNKLISEALAIETEEAIKANALGYMARMLVQATMPHSKIKETSFERSNGSMSLAIMAHPSIGLPYGTYPRLILAWLVTEAVKTKNPIIELGSSLSEFMAELGLIPTGGRWGTIWRLREQLQRLFSSSISCTYNEGLSLNGMSFSIAREYHLWWSPKQPEQAGIWQSTVTLSQDFFTEIIDRPVPIDMRALKALKSSAMALDLYCWLTHRMSYLKHNIEVPWLLLQKQFGANYADTKQGKYEFKRKLLAQLKKVMVVYNKASKIEEGESGLILSPGNTHIRKLK